MKGMKKRYLAWSLMISLLTGTLFGNSGISWASENINPDKAINTESDESSLGDDSILSIPSNARSDNDDADVDVEDEESDIWDDYDLWMLLTGDTFLRLAKQLEFVDVDDINIEYLKTESNNRKILGKVLDIKFPEKEETVDTLGDKVVATSDFWDEIKDERGYAEFLVGKVNDALEYEGIVS